MKTKTDIYDEIRTKLIDINDELKPVQRRCTIMNAIIPVVHEATRSGIIYDSLVVCDERNNPTEETLHVDVYTKESRDVEFILTTFWTTKTDVSYEELTDEQ